MIGNELFKLEQELQFGEGKELYPWEHNDDLCPFKILKIQEVQMSQELFWETKKCFLTLGIKEETIKQYWKYDEGPEALERAIPAPLLIRAERNDTSQLGLQGYSG